MKEFILRSYYRFLFWMADNAHGSDIQIGFYRNFKKPNDIPARDLISEIKRLSAAINDASDVRV